MSIPKSDNLLSVFSHFPLFQGVPEEVLVVFFIAAEEELVRKGQLIVRENEQGDRLYFVGGGAVDVVKNHGQDHGTVLATLGENEFFGEMCVIEPIDRSATVVAREPSFLYSIKSSTFNKVYQVWPEQQIIIMNNLAKELAKRVEALDPSYLDRGY